MSDVQIKVKHVAPDALTEMYQWLEGWVQRHDLEADIHVDRTVDALRRFSSDSEGEWEDEMRRG